MQALARLDGLRALVTRDVEMQHVADSDGTPRVELVLPTRDDDLRSHST